MMGGALNVGLTPVEIKEIVYQAVPCVGLAKVFDFLTATNEVLTPRGISLPLPPQSTTNPETRLAKGLEVQRSIFGDRIDQLYAQFPRISCIFSNTCQRTALATITRAQGWISSSVNC